MTRVSLIVGFARGLSFGLVPPLVLATMVPCTAQIESPFTERRDVTQPRADPPGGSNVITVRPSGADARPREVSIHEGRLERLERRLRRSDEAMRSICVGCGSREAGGAMFNPADVLRGRVGAPSQMLVPRRLPDEVIVEMREIPGAPPETTSREPEGRVDDPVQPEP